MTNYTVNDSELSLSALENILQPGTLLELSAGSIEKINRCRNYLDEKLGSGDHIFYGINTGFGSLYNKQIPREDQEQLQLNLIMSHACGTGNEIPDEIVKLMLFLKIQGMSYGNSGVQLDTVNLMIAFFNHGILPVVYEQGSLGASGDLAPLAHLCLPLLGMGEVKINGVKQPAADALKRFNLSPVTLRSKEGLALLNGTQFMSAFACHALLQASRLEKIADITGALSLEGFDGRLEPFHELIHKIRSHNGQVITSARYRKILEGSNLISRHKEHVQDPYAFRCIPQVHGATKDTLAFAEKVIVTEINSVTDNPTVFPDQDLIISAGNFHGQPLALILDYLAIALSELGNISERRTYQLISGLRGLPPFLVANPGLNSGFMIPQYTAASIVSQNKQLSTPASVDSIVSSNGQEDHVSMGANAATKLFRVVCNLEKILAIELMCAVQAIEFRRPLRSSENLEKIITSYRESVSFMEKDRILYTDIDKSISFLNTFNFNEILN